jgi:hypothetical protein
MSIYASRIIFSALESHSLELQETIDNFLETLEANGIKACYEHFVDGKCVAFNEAAFWQPEGVIDQQIIEVQGEQA